MKHKIFVYGSLKRGGGNHGLMAGQRFIATGRTQPVYRLFALDSYPAMVDAAQDGRSIQGEIWEIDPERMPTLDQLEDLEHGMYARVKIPLLAPHNKLKVEGYVYRRSIAGRKECGEIWPV